MSNLYNPFTNVVTLLEQFVKMKQKRDDLVRRIDAIPVTLDNIDEIDKLEEELEFVTSYAKTMMDQAVVIMNENDVRNLPTLYDLESRIPLLTYDK